MPREEVEQYEQDNLGNSRRKLDRLRAQEGQVGNDGTQGLHVLASDGTTDDTDTNVPVYSLPSDADRVHITEVYAHNSGSTGTFHIVSGSISSGSIPSATRRSVDMEVVQDADRRIEYEGDAIENATDEAIGVNSEFPGQVAVAVVVDHEEYSEPNSEDTSTPS